MNVQRFSTGKQFVWRDVTYEVKQLLPSSQLLLENVETAERCTVAFIELAEALFAGALYFIERNEDTGTVMVSKLPTLADYPPHLRALAEYRLEVIRPLLALPAGERSREHVAARVTEIQHAQQTGTVFPSTAISIASIYRWIQMYERSGHDVRALVGNSQGQGGKGQSHLTEEVEAILQTVIQDRWHVSEQVTCDDIYLEIGLRIAEENRLRHAGEKLLTPSRTTVWRRINALDDMAKLIAKRGKRAAQRQMAQYGQMDYPSIPLSRVEIDHTPIDLIVVDGHDNLPLGRPTLTYCLDTTTRYPLGFYLGFEPPSYLTVMECLYHAILTKEGVRETHNTEHDWIAYGIPAVLIVDNGKEFIGNDLQDACHSLGIELVQMPLRTPHFKATVERMFRTLNTGLLHTLPGTTFSNPQQRGAYDSVAEACIDLEDLLHLLHIFLLDVYAESFHRGLGAIPAHRWNAIMREGFFPRVPASAEELQILLGRVAHRVIHHYGIEFLRLRYNSQDLAPLRSSLGTTRAKIKYNPSDLGRIYVYDPQRQNYIEVACLNQEYAQGLSLWKHRVILNRAREEEAQVDMLSLARAKRRIQEIVEQSRTTKKAKRRARVARWKSDVKSASRQVEDGVSAVEEAQPSLFPPPAQAQPDLPFLDLKFPVILADLLEDEEWRVGYDLPDTNPNERHR